MGARVKEDHVNVVNDNVSLCDSKNYRSIQTNHIFAIWLSFWLNKCNVGEARDSRANKTS